VVFLSMVAAPGPDRRLSALTAMQYVQRYNVAVSRARDQLWVFHSMDQSTLTNPEDMRYQLLDYCYGVARRSAVTDERQSTSLVPEDLRVAPFGSLFEQRVHNRILDHGYTLIPQYESLGYSIDLVAVGPTARLAIECDGDFWHGPEAHQRDMGRQRELERCGWRFHRILESEFSRDPARALEPLWARLAELDIRPAGWASPVPDAEPLAAAEPEDSSDSEAPTPPLGLAVVSPLLVSPAAELIPPAPAPEQEPEQEPKPEIVAAVPAQGAPLLSTAETTGYQEFHGKTIPAASASQRELVEGLVAIVAVEGPILGHRLHSVYVRSASGARVGSQITKILNSAVSAALRQGRLVRDNPLGEVGIKPATLRLPDQPEVRIRPLGPRSFDQIPPAELAAVMAEEAEPLGWADAAAVYRATMARYGIRQLGSAIRARLEEVARLVGDDVPS
jgi:very-short-patch-repair endonuclease